MMAAVGAIIASAAAGAAAPDAGAAARKLPVVDSISPRNVAIGQTLSIRGRHFLPGRYKNTVVFKRDGNRAVFAKAEVGTKKLLRVTVPARLKELLLVRDGSQIATPFRLRVLAKRLGKSFTTGARVPMVGPELPPAPESPPEAAADGDCDLDKVINRDDADDDNDLLPDAQEASLGTDACKSDSDEDGVTDGYEYQSAVDLNDDEYQEPQSILPAPVKKPYPNPLYADANVDYDGDSLRLGQEFALWKAYRDPAAGPARWSGRTRTGRTPSSSPGPRPPATAT